METEFSRVVDALPAFVWTAHPNGHIEYLNQRWCEYTGLSIKQSYGPGWQIAIHADDLDGLLAGWRGISASGAPVEAEARVRGSDGQYRWFLFRGHPSAEESGQVVKWCGLGTDIDQRRQAEEAVRERERRAEQEHHLTIDAIPTLVATYRPDGSRIFVNRTWLEYTGLSLDSAIDAERSSIAHPDDAARVAEEWKNSLATATPFKTELRLRRADGAYRWHSIHRVLQRDETGEVVKWYSVGVDIEERKRAEDALRQSEARLADAERELQRTIDTIPTLVTAYRPGGSRIFVNRSWLQYSGISRDEAFGPTRWSMVHPDDLERVDKEWQISQATETPSKSEVRLRRADGEYRWHVIHRVFGRDEAGRVVRWYSAALDIEDRKLAEEELRRSQTLLAEGQRISSTGTLSWRVDANELTFSEELCRIFELDYKAPVTFEQVFERVHPEDRPLLSERMQLVRCGRTPGEQEIRLRTPDKGIKYVRTVGQMVQHQDGRREYLGAIQDVTERRLAENALDTVRSELAHITRVMTLSALTASIAHEVNQPLAGIITNASTCLRMLGAEPPNIEGARETARRTIRDGNRATDVIARLRVLFSKKATAAETVDLNEAIREVVALVSNDLMRNRVLPQMELDNDRAPLVKGDRVQLQQVIMNLVRNASDAMSEVFDRPRHLLIRVVSEEEGARVVVRDVGVGFEPEHIDRLFDTFYTTKSDGMGIGLSVSRSIIERHGGTLWAERNDGPGATFSFSIPRQAVRPYR